MLIGAAYIRVSTDDQLDLSPDSQLDEIKKYAAANDIVLSPDYIFMEQEGRSGKKAENRPEFQRMISTAKVKPKPFDCILVWKFSRFARNQDESTFYKGMLRKKLGIDVVSVSEPIMEGMYGRLIEMIIEWQDEFYSYNLGVEVKRGMTKKAELKGYQIVPCLGYAAVGNGKPFVIVEDEYKIVEDIFRMYALENLDRTSIARRLNAQGKKAKRGNPFEQRTITRILTNPFYNGTVSWNGISFQGSHETRQSVTGLYDICQERLKREFRPVKRRSISTCRHWLSGILKCSVCGATMSYNGGGKSRPDAVFACWKYAKGLHKESCSVTVAKAERIVIRSLEKILETGNFEYDRIPQPVSEQAAGQKAAVEEKLERLSLKEERIRAAYENGIDSLEEYRERKERLAAERKELEEELASLEPASCSPALSREELLERVKTVHDLLCSPDVDFETKGTALRSILKFIVFDRKADRFEFHYYIS
ncbi:MAG: recombinase family protein [Clostridium sp.]|nr:recombinase family protein [Clostridium sp.]